MGLPASKSKMSVEEYFEFEERSEEKHEYDEGEILAMSGGSAEHSFIAANLITALSVRLRGKGCRVAESNLRVRWGKSNRYVYPDALVVCGPPEFDPLDKRRTTILNPRVIVEVVSESTEGYDRGRKFERYREIGALEEYVLVEQVRPRVDTFFLKDGLWVVGGGAEGLGASVELASLRLKIPLAEVYEGIVFPVAGDGTA